MALRLKPSGPATAHTHFEKTKYEKSLWGFPMARVDAWVMYADMLSMAREQGGDETVFECERWLGMHDLFYLLVRQLRREDVDNDWIFDRCREVERDRNWYLDLWARDHYKSTIITFAMTIQDILLDPEITVGIFSHTRPVAKKFLQQIKNEFEQNQLLKALYPDVLWADPRREASKWSEDDGIIVRRKSNPKESTVEAWGLVDGQPTGRHYKLRVYDDVVTRESVSTPEQIEKTTSAWELSDNLGSRGGVARYIGTRYALYDTYSVMLKREAVTPRIYAATHNGRMDGRPVYLTDQEWERKLRTTSRSMIASQQLQNPMADETAMFKTEWLRQYEVRPRTLNVYILCDPSRGRSNDSDNTAMAVIGVSVSGAKYLLDGFCHRMSLTQRWINLRNLYKKWSKTRGAQHVGVGYERYGMQTDDEYFKERQQREDLFFNIEELAYPRDGTNSKRERVERLEPDFRNSRFYLPLPVYYDGKPSVWEIDTYVNRVTGERSPTWGDILYHPVQRLTKQQVEVVEAGSPDLVARAIKCVDQDGKVYDLTLRFIEEYSYFPFGQHKDLIDATSRIYDMGMVVPMAEASLREPTPCWDR